MGGGGGGAIFFYGSYFNCILLYGPCGPLIGQYKFFSIDIEWIWNPFPYFCYSSPSILIVYMFLYKTMYTTHNF